MGLSISFVFSPWKEVLTEKMLGSALVKTALFRSASFSGRDSEQSVNLKKRNYETMLSPDRPHKKIIKESMSFKNWKPDMVKLDITNFLKNVRAGNDSSELISCKSTANDSIPKLKPPICLPDLALPKPRCELNAAALKLQKVYKSYRTRRNLADCAVVAEELWWKALDFAALERSSVSFFDINKQETAVSRWSRARTRVAKVGKGLSKDEKAQKLALQHWLEAIDPRHRYGHNLHLYYVVWFKCESTQPFFYWLDVGDGKEVNLEQCMRNNLQHQCIEYLGSKEREKYEVIVENGKLVYKQSGELVNTAEGSKWIFVLSTSRALYVGQKIKGAFQHSSFLAGGATTAAGRLVAEDGVLKATWPYSGHYQPTKENFKEFVSFLEEHNVDLTNVKMYATDDDRPPSKVCEEACREEAAECPTITDAVDSDVSKVDESAEESVKAEDDMDNDPANAVAPTFNMGKPSSRKWATGAGLRIGIVRDYPAELQCRALEQVNLSPRVTPAPSGTCGPIPSPRPSPKVRLSPRLTYMGLPSPRVVLPNDK
ncbi:IQ domain-containing protein IQM1-like [Magnolia sinica]|uniref:IQ domain-containing protein IQM1-like n=1 Tax=Magnolia sinica TaxID=86752 RepID=UPI002658CCD5|nr:IQ domain-containing protein IQM1-like [Magnolia sinica]